MQHHVTLGRRPLAFKEHFPAHEVWPLRAKTDRKPSMFSMPCVIQGKVVVQFLTRHVIVKHVQVVDIALRHLAGRAADGDREIAACAKLIQELSLMPDHFRERILSEGRCARSKRFQHIYIGCRQAVFRFHAGRIWLLTAHHPILGILRKPAEQVQRSMHMPIHQAWKNELIRCINYFFCFICARIRHRHDGNDLARIYGDCAVVLISYAFPSHGERIRIDNQGIYPHTLAIDPFKIVTFQANAFTALWGPVHRAAHRPKGLPRA